MSRGSPPWQAPAANADDAPGLRLYNSLTRRKDVFTPAGKLVTWYSCGPTVYDHAHMGHARSYISFDILRRVLTDYFNYRILYVQNVTDIDDKIIKRARTNYLYDIYKRKSPLAETVAEDVMKALELHQQRMAVADPDKLKMLQEQMDKVNVSAVCLHQASALAEVAAAAQVLLNTAEPLLGEWLDREQGSTVTDNTIFMDLPRHFEEEYNADMERLNVLPPNIVTRVSEYVPEIVRFVERIIDNGYAYTSNGSVYFDVAKFDAEPHHYYAKLVPEAYGNQSALQEGEGDLSSADQQEKKSPNDFALWKNSKPGEPAWPSPWGQGRPGWHIECSAMAGEILGSSVDIHSGGVDLKFPHHDNELAQSEAHYQCGQWITYFLHTGHLHIDGCKMSKSLKNFISIGDALKEHSAPLLRLAFLLHQWKDTLDYSSNTMEGARQYHKMVTEFGLNVSDLSRRCRNCSNVWADSERLLSSAFEQARASVHRALCDSVDTRATLDHLRELITETNKYMNTNDKRNDDLARQINSFVRRILSIFGVELPAETAQEEMLALCHVVADVRERLRSLAKEGSTGVKELKEKLLQLCDDIRDTLLPPLGVRLEDKEEGAPSIKLVDPQKLTNELQKEMLALCHVVADVRERLRNLANEGSSGVKELQGMLLQLCDDIRDTLLPPLGVRLEDREGGAPSIKLVDPRELAKELQTKREAEEAKRLEKQKKKEAAEAKLAQEKNKHMVPPESLYRTGEYSAWDAATGLPTHDAQGEEITKSQGKKLAKLMDAYKKKYDKWKAQQ